MRARPRAGALGLSLWLCAAMLAAQTPTAADLDHRAAALQRRAATTAPGTPAALALSRDLTELGEICLERGETGRATELLEQACAFDTENGAAQAALTLAYVRAENFEAARFYLTLARENAPRAPASTYRTIAEVYEALHRLDDAVDAWEEYVRLNGEEPAALSRLARLKAEVSLGGTQSVLVSDPFTVFSDPAIPAVTVAKTAATLVESYRAQSAFLETTLTARQPVILYAGRSYFALASVPDWVSGVFDGKIRVCVETTAGATPELAGVLAHELAHALIRRASGDRAPGWLHEGLAQWLEGRRLTRHDFRQIFAGQKPLSLSDLDTLFTRRVTRADARRHYAEMLGLVEYLVAERGEGGVSCLVRAYAGGRSSEEVLRLESGLTPEGLLSGWKTWAGLTGRGERP